MRYEIVATLGPASREEQSWRAMLAAGASAFRLNTSHLSLAELDAWLERLTPFLNGQGRPVPLALDLQGSKWRLGQMDPLLLEEGRRVTLALAEQSSDPQVLPVPHADFFKAAQRSDGVVVLNDAKARFQVEQAGESEASAVVTMAGPVAGRKGITVPNSDYRVEALSGKDRAIIKRARGLPFARFAVSYIKDAGEMRRYRELFGPGAYLIAKLERPGAVIEAREACAWCDELWLCRGDLGAEAGLAGMAKLAHAFGAEVRALPRPALIAGQVFEHMTHNPTPTRAEVCSLYDALAEGYRGAVLSDECAIGLRPVEAARAAAMFLED